MFGIPTNVGLDGPATGVVADDLSGSGNIDVALILRGLTPADQGSVLVLFNDGGGEISSVAQYPVGREPSGIVAGDFTGNGVPDLAVTNGADNTVSVLINDGTGGFSNGEPVGVGIAPSAITTGDLRGIGIMDLAVTNAGSNDVHVLHNDGAGNFTAQSSIAVGIQPIDIRAANVLGSGHISLVVANFGDPNPGAGASPIPGSVTIFANNGAREFAHHSTLTAGLGPGGLGAEDLDNNKDIDIVVFNRFSNNYSIFKNLGNGTFSSAINLSLPGSPQSMAAWDMNGDGSIDLAIVIDDPELGNVVRILRNDSVGSTLIFSHDSNVGEGEHPVLITHGDVTGDGLDDLISIDSEGGGAAGESENFAVSVWPNLSAPPGKIFGDLNNDGVVNVKDLLILVSSFGPCPDPSDCPADLNSDGVVDPKDLMLLLAEITSGKPGGPKGGPKGGGQGGGPPHGGGGPK